MSERTYRLSPRDRSGWFLGLGGAQVVVLGTALVTSAVAVQYGAPLLLGALVLAVAGALALGRLGGRPLVEWTPHALRWAAQRRTRTWFAPLPTLVGPAVTSPPLPPPLDAQVVLAVPGPGGGEMAVVADRDAGTLAATLRVAGRQFLIERADQDALLALWGDALGAFCREAAAVVEVRWSEWAAPAGMEDTHAYLAEHALDDPADPAVASYRQLLRSAAPVATRHEVLVTVVVSMRRVRPEARHDGDRSAAATEVLAEELRRLARRLEAAGLSVSAPLNPAELARALRVRLDPTALATLDRRARSLGERAGVVAPAGAGPLCATAGRRWWEVDGSLHRAFALTEWPRAEVGPTWMADLLAYAGAVRTIAVSYTPVPPRVSQRAIARQAARLEADVDQRRRGGFRVGAHHRRASAAVEEREEELVAGFAELAYAGVIDVCAADPEALERACADVVQAAAACGIELCPLDRRHDQGAAACLPLAYGLAPRLVAG